MANFAHQIVEFDAGEQAPLFFALALCGGAAWYVTAWFEPPLVWLAGAFAGLLALSLGCRSFRFGWPLVRLIVLIALGCAGGAVSGKAATLRAKAPTLTAPIGPVMLEGWVEAVEPGKKGPRLRILVHAIDGMAAAERPRHVRLTHITRLEVENGRFVRCWAVLRPPPRPVIRGDFAFHRQAYFEGLGGVGYVQGRCRGGTLGAPAEWREALTLKISQLRRGLAHHVFNAAGPAAGGFAAAVSSGDRSFLRPEDQDALRGSGLAHLLAISGLHMGIIGGLVYLMVWRGLALIQPLALRIAVQKPAALAALGASAVYLVLSGASVSTQRAFVMALILFGAVLFDRAALSLRSLAIAMIIVVILAPWSVLSPGFQMSFAATGALIATFEAWQKRRRQKGSVGRKSPAFWAQSLFVTSLVSSLATAPFALYHFDRFATLGLIANLFAMPIVSLAAAPLAGAALVLAPFGLSEPALRLFGYSLEWVLKVGYAFDNAANQAGYQAGSGIMDPGGAMPAASLIAFTAALSLAMICTGYLWRLLMFIGFSALGVWLWAGASHPSVHWAPSGDVFIDSGHETTQRIGFVDGEGLGPLRYIETEMTGTCSDGACTIPIAGTDLVLAHPGAEARHNTCGKALTLVSARQPERLCAQTAHWEDVVSSGGLSWHIIEGEPVPIRRMPCGRRPWAPCLEPAAAIEQARKG